MPPSPLPPPSPGSARPSRTARLARPALLVAATVLVVLVAGLPSAQPGAAAPARRPSTISAQWNVGSAYVDETLVVRGKVGPTKVRRTVALQARVAGTQRFRTVRTTKAGPRGAYSMSLRLATAGRYEVRALVRRTRAARQRATRPVALAVYQRPSTMTASWPSRTAKPGASRYVTGQVQPWQGRVVVVQRQVAGGGWVSEASAELSGPSYRLPVPTRGLGTFGLRVVTNALRTHAATGRDMSGQLTVRPTWNPPGRSNQFRRFESSPPARWDGCQPIDYKINARRARARGVVKDVKTAVRRVEIATGLNFRYRGATRITPQRRGLKGFGDGTDLIIAWAGPQHSTMYPRGDQALGRGGPVYHRYYHRDTSGRRTIKIQYGKVVMNPRYDRGYLKNGAGRGYTRVSVVMHEIGHTLGLDHAPSSSQIMYRTVTKRVDQWGAGDLNGLRLQGWTQGCLRPETASEAARTARRGAGDVVPPSPEPEA